MADILRDPIWQGVGVIITVILGAIGFYYEGKNKVWLIVAGAIVILITGFALGSTSQPKINNDSNEIERINQHVFAYYGEAENAGGFARLELIFDASTGKPAYELDYNLPGDKSGYAGLAFQVNGGSNLSAYKAVECTLTFSQLSDVVDLYFKDIAGNFNTIRISNNGANEMKLRNEFTNFPAINFNAVKEFGIVVGTEFTTGSHKVQIKNVRFVE
jgi:hypothetical protein